MEIIKKAIETERDGTSSKYVIVQSGNVPSDDEWSFEYQSEKPDKVFVFHNVEGGFHGEVDTSWLTDQRDDNGKRMDGDEIEALFLALYALQSDSVPFDDVRRTIDTVTVQA